MDKVLYKICDMFHEVLEEYAEKGHFADKSAVETAKAAVSGITKIKTIEAMERFDGNSFRHSYGEDGYASRRSYDSEGSYRRGRGMDGRYVSRDSIKDKLARMMDEATNEQERNMIREMLDKMQ